MAQALGRPGQIKAVTFDVWATLLHDQRPVRARWAPTQAPAEDNDPLASAAGAGPNIGVSRSQSRVDWMTSVLRDADIAVTDEQVHEAYEGTWRYLETEIWTKNEELDTRDQLRWLLANLGANVAGGWSEEQWRELERAYVEPFFTTPPRLAEGAREALATLREREFRIGLICNTGVTPGWAIRRYFEELGILAHFDTLAFSNEERVRKPDPEIYRRVLGKLEVEAGQAVHIGDDVITDIHGAKSVGMRAILVRPDLPAGIPSQPDAHLTDLIDLVATIARL